MGEVLSSDSRLFDSVDLSSNTSEDYHDPAVLSDQPSLSGGFSGSVQARQEMGSRYNVPMPVAALVEQTMVEAINRG